MEMKSLLVMSLSIKDDAGILATNIKPSGNWHHCEPESQHSRESLF